MTPPPELELLVPGLFATFPAPPLPTLALLHARGDRITHGHADAPGWLLERSGLAAAAGAPMAALALRGEGHDPGGDWWLRADPVHLAVNRGELMLADSGAFDLGVDEAGRLAASINAHFEADGLAFLPLHPQRWYLRLPGPVDMRATPPWRLRGAGIGAHRPEGADALRWQRLAGEVQMILHDHAVNAAREARGDLPVNALWLWGAGKAGPVPAFPWAAAFADDPLAAGLARTAGRPAAPLPGCFSDWIAGAPPERSLVVVDALWAPADYGDRELWATRRTGFESDWLGPAVAALRRGALASLTLHDAAPGVAVTVRATRGSLRRFWRRAPVPGHKPT